MRDRVRRVTLALWCAGTATVSVGACGQSAAASPTALSNEQMRHFRRMGSPRLSPDGKHVLLQVWDATAGGGKSHLWLVDVAGGEPRQLTVTPDSDKRGERAGEWMPDGGSVLFLAHRGEHTSLYRLPMSGGEARALDLKVPPAADESKRADAVPPAPADKSKVAPAEEKPEPIAIDVDGYRVAPDGKTLAVWANDPETPGEKRGKDAKADAQWVNHDTHGSRLYLLRMTDSENPGPKDGTRGTQSPAEKNGETLTAVAVAPDVRSAAWSPDAKRLVVLADGPNDAGDLAPAMSAWMVEESDPAHPVRLPEIPATVDTATWSADGADLFFLAGAEGDAPPGYADLYRYRMATKQVENLSDGFAGSVGGEILAPAKTRGPWVLAEMGVDAGLVTFPGAAGGTRVQESGSPPPRVELGGAPTKVGTQELMRPGGESAPVLREANTNAVESGWVFLASGGGKAPTLLFKAELRGDAAATVLKTPAMVPDGFAITAPAKRVHWSNEKLGLDGLLYLPSEASATHRVPLVVEVHGGPLGAYLDEYDPFAQFLVGHGWAVLRTNPRGSTGRGAVFAAANKNDLGGGDFRDVMSGVEYVLKTEPALDGERMALMGYSYGGEMAGFAEGQTTRFRAIVSMAPVIDQQSEYGTEKGSWYDRWYFGRPWEHAVDAWRQSPLSGVPKAKTPFLLIQGESDSTDPLGQAQEMYRALRQQGVTVELVTYPREDHGPLATGIYGRPSTEPWHGYDARQRIVAFVERAFAGAK